MPQAVRAIEGLLGQRFQVEAEVGRGGMGRILRAQDLRTGSRVAIKVLHQRGNRTRFEREIAMMASLSHSSIVSYIAHGATIDGRPFVALEWLDGEDLSQRLRRSGLTLHESLALMRCVVGALRYVHNRGIAHLDIKPGNLFLRAGRPDQVVLLDFGIAQETDPGKAPPETDLVLGTPQYMSPEQAQGLPDIGPASDVFSLGCVLYECLAGVVPHPGTHLAVVLSKILFAKVQRLAELRPEYSCHLEVIDSFLEQVLVKAPEARLQDADALWVALDNLPLLPDFPPPPRAQGDQVMVAAQEQRLVSVVVALPPGACGVELGTMEIDSGASNPDGSRTNRLNNQDLVKVLDPAGVQVELLADGSIVITAGGDDEQPVDPVVRAARCAFLLKDRLPHARIALATGRGLLHQRLPEGEVMERVSAVLNQLDSADFVELDGVWADEVSGNLLEARYAMQRYGHGYLLHGERGLGEESRLLLGKSTPCVGRERELALLDRLAQESDEDRVARAALIIAPIGAGKTRLRQEFVRRLRERGSRAQVIVSATDVMSAGASYGLMAEVIRNLCGILEGEPLQEKCSKLRQRVGSIVPASEETRVAVFLGEICGANFPDQASPILRAARQDHRLLTEQIEQALIDLFRAQCERQPLVLFLEDLHWGDALTVRLLDEALRSLEDRPLLIVATARPEVKQLFPSLWSERAMTEFRLPALPRKASERLIEHLLGDAISPAERGQLVSQAAGNALMLEELIRQAAEGRFSERPATVLAVLQARIDRLDSQARRLLRAASVYGAVFWRGGVAAIMSEETLPEDLDEWLEVLRHHELIEGRRNSRFVNEVEYVFRHDLAREASYSLLTDADRPRCHQVALDYLCELGESDPLVLASHAERAGEQARAAAYFTAAARHAFNCSDWEQLNALAARAIACGAIGELLGQLRNIQAFGSFVRGEYDQVALYCQEALSTVAKNGADWCSTQRLILILSFFRAPQVQFVQQCQDYLNSEPEPLARGQYLRTCSFLLPYACQRGLCALAAIVSRRLDDLERQVGPEDILAHASLKFARADWFRFIQMNLMMQRQCVEDACEGFQRIGAKAELYFAVAMRAALLGESGDFAGGDAALREIEQTARAARNHTAARFAQLHLAALLVQAERPQSFAEAKNLLLGVMAQPGVSVGHRGWAHALLGQIALLSEQLEAAEQEVRTGLGLLSTRPFLSVVAQTILIRTLRSQGRIEEAQKEAELALLSLAGLSEQSYPAIPLFVEVAQTRYESGDTVGASSALSSCLVELDRQANLLIDPRSQQRFLCEIPAHARARKMAQSWNLAVTSKGDRQ